MSEFVLTRAAAQVKDLVGTGTNTVPFPQGLNRTIMLVTYNTLTMIPESNPPDSQGWYYDSDPSSPTFQNLIFGINIFPDDIVQIIYK